MGAMIDPAGVTSREVTMSKQYEAHHRTHARLGGFLHGPVRTGDQHKVHNNVARFNKSLAVTITNAVGSMWCAYIFAAIALVGLPAAIGTHSPYMMVAWLSQTFLQLVLLSIIIVG